MSQKNLVRLDANGIATVLATGYSPLGFDPSVYGNSVFIVDDGITAPTVNTVAQTVPVTTRASSLAPSVIGSGFASFAVAPEAQELTSTTSTSFTTFSLAEQKIDGTGYGTFTPTELVFQSTIQPEVINYLSLGGVTATEYNPTIGTTGATGTFVGSRAAQFKGSYLDTDTAAAGISLPGISSASYFLISGWLLMETAPTSAYDPIVITRSPDGVSGSTSDSFRLEYDYSSSRFQFHFSTTANTTSAGFDHTMNASPVGVTLNEWHHFAVAYTNAGSSAAVSSYWNGNQVQKYTGATGSIRGSDSSVYVGCGGSGKKPFKGWIDDLVVSAGTTPDALRGFLHGSTAPVPTTKQHAGFYTVFCLSMDGPIGTSLFPCDTSNKMTSNVAAQTDSLYIYGNIGVTASKQWTTPFTGVCGGHAVAGASAGYIFGYQSGACWIPSAVTEISSGLTAAKQYRKDLADYSLRYYLGLTMYGITGASGDFPNLFSGSTYPSSFVYTPLETNLNYLKNIYDSIIVAGSTADVSVADANGTYYTFATAAAVNLYKDVSAYFNRGVSQFTNVNTRIDSQASFSNLKLLSGPTATAVVSKLAATGNQSLFISPISTITKTNRIPEKNWDTSSENEPPVSVP
jgi:hypothetical protein